MLEPDTICAISTPPGRAALAIIRVSGSGCLSLIQGLANLKESPQPRQVYRWNLKDSDGNLLDDVIGIYFKAPNSFTGEDLLEIHCHGNPLIYERILTEIVSRGTRQAEPGEFTRRAVLNEKMDLLAADRLGDLLSSRSMEDLKSILNSKIEDFGEVFRPIRDEILEIRTLMEAGLDYTEVEVGQIETNEIGRRLEAVQIRLRKLISQIENRRKSLESRRIVLVGRPNSGKSTLFNTLLGHERAIVHHLPGTTRDFLEADWFVNGSMIRLLDTAGIRDAQDGAEKRGVQKTLEIMKGADLILWVSEDESGPDIDLQNKFSDKNWFLIKSKADLRGQKARDAVEVSSHTGDGIEVLISEIGDFLNSKSSDLPLLPSSYLSSAVAALESLESLSGKLKAGENLELVAEEMRAVEGRMAEVYGKTEFESLLGSILSRFCIGK